MSHRRELFVCRGRLVKVAIRTLVSHGLFEAEHTSMESRLRRSSTLQSCLFATGVHKPRRDQENQRSSSCHHWHALSSMIHASRRTEATHRRASFAKRARAWVDGPFVSSLQASRKPRRDRESTYPLLAITVTITHT